MKTLSVLELSKLYNMNRQTIYNNINKGILSKKSDGKIDLSEAIRVFGEPKKNIDVNNSVKIDIKESAEFALFRQQIDILKNQLSDAKDRELFYQNQIEAMQRLLEAPKPHKNDDQDVVTEPTATQNPEVISGESKNSAALETKKEQPKQRGFWNRFFT